MIFLATPAEASEGYCSLNDGIKADGKTTLENGGKKHEFCCSGCLDKFKEDPEDFSRQVHQPALASSVDAEAACTSVCGE